MASTMAAPPAPLRSPLTPSHRPAFPSPSLPLAADPYNARRRLHRQSISRGPVPPAAAVAYADAVAAPATDLLQLKLNLLSAVAGLNRGLAASQEDLKRADSAAKDLESAGGAVDLSGEDGEAVLQGRWRLVYSSAFSSQTLGGSRPGPPTRRLLPIALGQVFQRIDVVGRDFDNIVELQLGSPWPLPPVEATATLAHKFELIGTSKIKITFEKTTVKGTAGSAQLPQLELPRLPDALRPPSSGAGEFEVTYADREMRVTRGDRGELRVFVVA